MVAQGQRICLPTRRWIQSLEKEMATHSSVLAWEIPQTEEPGWLQSVGAAKQLNTTERLNNNNISISEHSET